MNLPDEFTAAYFEAALRSSSDESDERGGDPLDKNYDFDDIAPETAAQMIEDCAKFQAQHGHLITRENCLYTGCSEDKYAGHDFWLTRNGHGAGFWDGDWVEPVGEELTKAAESFGGFDLYVGDDNEIYGMAA